jgi:hypothetical protein
LRHSSDRAAVPVTNSLGSVCTELFSPDELAHSLLSPRACVQFRPFRINGLRTLLHSFAQEFLRTLLESIHSPLFAKKRGCRRMCLGGLWRSAPQSLEPAGKVRTNACKSFSCYIFADPHPINPVVSYPYKIMGRGVPTRAPASNIEPLTSKFSPHAGNAPPTVVFGGIGGAYGADGAPGAITGWKRR